MMFFFGLQVKITLEVNDFQDFFDADDEVILDKFIIFIFWFVCY